MYPKSRTSALMALLAAGGLYAWRNRDKIQSWINDQRAQYTNQDNTTFPSTGATRRIDTDMNRGFEIPKAPPKSAAIGIFDGLENGEDEIFPDPASRSIAEGWRTGAVKTMSREFAAFVPATRG